MSKTKAKSPLTELRFPVGGLNRRAGFDQQPPYTTPYAINARPFDSVATPGVLSPGQSGYQNRSRGGARIGLIKAFSQQLGSGAPIQLLDFASLAYPGGNVVDVLIAVANGTLYTNWANSGTMAAVSGGNIFNPTGQLQGVQIGQYYYIADYRQNNIYSQTGTVRSGGVTLYDPSGALGTGNGVQSITTSDVVWISPADPTQANVFPISAYSATGGPGSVPQITFTGTGANAITAQSGVTYQINRIPQVYNPINNTLAPLMGVGTVPIPSTNYTAGTVTISAGSVTLSGGSWATILAAIGSPPPASASLVITIPNTSGVGQQQYAVASFGNTTATLFDTTSDANVTSAPYTLSYTGTYFGVPPLGCSLCTNYRGRLVLAGGAWSNIWYMSRVQNANDWYYGADPSDTARAVAGTNASSGGPQQPLTAVISHTSQQLLFGCEQSVWLCTNDPASSGQIGALSTAIGILGASAWCGLPDGSIVFLSRDGLYIIPPDESTPQPISRPLLPAELLNIDWINNTITMAYDIEAQGVLIAVTPANGSAGTHYFLDWVNKGFWPIVYGANAVQPTALTKFASTSALPSHLLMGCTDGYLRRFSPAATNDDGSSFNSIVAYGPFRPGGPGYVGQLIQIAADLDPNGTGGTWSIYGGNTSEDAYAAMIAGAPIWTGTWLAGFNHRDYPRAAANAIIIAFSGTYGWAIEGLRIETKKRGPAL